MKSGLISIILALALSPQAMRAEDWTVNGKEYHNVKVGQVESDRVHITYDGGLGTVALADLTPQLQKRFNYNVASAKAATQDRENAVNEATSDLASRAETENPTFLQGWTQKVQQESDAAVTNAGKAHAKLQEARLEMFQKFVSGQPGLSVADLKDIKNWMDCAMEDKICPGMPKPFVLAAWGQPDSETTDTDGFDMLNYGNYSSTVYVSNGVVSRISQTSAGSSQ